MAKEYNKVEVKNNMNVENESVEEVNTPREKKDFKKVVSAQPKKRKKSLIGRLVTGVLGPEGLPNIGTYVNEEIVVPAIKNIVFDVITSAANMALYGERNPRKGTGGHSSYYRGPSTGYHQPRTNYSSRYNTSPQEQDHSRIARPSRYGVEEYTIENRFDAANVLTTLVESADMYGSVSVADYYDLIGVASQYTDNNWGWTLDGITQATVVPVRGGFVIKFPPLEAI